SLFRLIIVFHEKRFVGIDNYRFLLHDARFWTTLGNTTYFAVVSVSAEIVLWAIPAAISGKMWAWLFNPEYGVLTRILPFPGVNWLGTPGYAIHAAIVVDVWKTTPFVALLLFAALRSIPED